MGDGGRAARRDVVVDTREKAPWDFGPLGRFSVRRRLEFGDYALAGREDVAAVERKSVADLVETLIHAKERFARELRGLARMRRAWIVVEGTVADLVDHCRAAGGASAEAVLAACAALEAAWGVPVLWAGNRGAATLYALTLLDRVDAQVAALESAAAAG